MESKSLGDRLEAFLSDFVEELLLKDFASILTFNHPYRFRDEIVDLARRITYTPATMQVVAGEYLSSGMSAATEAARLDAEGDLLAIETMCVQIGDMFERIETFRRNLEARVRNTIKFAERGSQSLVGPADLVRRLDGLLAEARHGDARIETIIEPLRSPWSPHRHGCLHQPRRPVEAAPLAGRPTEPLYELRKRLRLEYIARIAPQPHAIRRFLDEQIPVSGAKEARFMVLRTVDDFLPFDAARRYALAGAPTGSRAPSASNRPRRPRRTTANGWAARMSWSAAPLPARLVGSAHAREFSDIEHSFGPDNVADLRKALHFLLRHQFVFAGDRGTAVPDNTIMDGRAAAAAGSGGTALRERLDAQPLADRENVPGSRPNAKIVWSAFVKYLPLFNKLEGRPTERVLPPSGAVTKSSGIGRSARGPPTR